MIETLSFRQVAPQLSPLRFSRKESLRLAYQGEEAQKFKTTAEARAILEKQENPALILFHPRVIPCDLERVFDIAQNLQKAKFDDFSSNFLSELQTYCRAVGFATLLEEFNGLGATRPLIGCNFMVGGPDQTSSAQFLNCNFLTTEPEAAQQAFFGPDYQRLTGRSIIVTPRPDSVPLGPYSLALYISHEVACIKLVEQAPKVGLRAADLSSAEEMFFTYAYSYNFNLHLLYYLDHLKDFLKLNEEQRQDVGNIMTTLEIFYNLAMDNFATMSPEEKRRFLIVSLPGCGMSFGQPFSVELTNQKTPSLTRIKTSLPV